MFVSAKLMSVSERSERKQWNNVTCADMSSFVTSVRVSSSGLNDLNKGKKRKIDVMNRKDCKRKILKDAGQPYISRRGKAVSGKPGPSQVCGTTCFVQIFRLILSE